MSRALVVLAFVVAALAPAPARAAAVDADPLHAPPCRDALDALHAAEAAASAPAARPQGAPAIGPALAAARKRAAQRCLASGADPPRPGRLAVPPVPVAPVASPRDALPHARPPERSVPAPPPGPPPLTSITSCDPAGCWTSDGSRLHRVGPTLWGSRGACSVQGTVVTCP